MSRRPPNAGRACAQYGLPPPKTTPKGQAKVELVDPDPRTQPKQKVHVPETVVRATGIVYSSKRPTYKEREMRVVTRPKSLVAYQSQQNIIKRHDDWSDDWE